MENQKTLYRIEDEKIFSGVCAGLSEYFNMDVGLVRVIFVLVLIFSGFLPIVIVYLVLAIILPIKYNRVSNQKHQDKQSFVNDDDYTINEDDYKY